MTTIPRIEELPAVPDGVSAWDGETECDTVRWHWLHPDNWPEPGRPVLELYQAVIGEELDDGMMAVHLAARYLESWGWEILAEDSNKDWAEITLYPPAGAHSAL